MSFYSPSLRQTESGFFSGSSTPLFDQKLDINLKPLFADCIRSNQNPSSPESLSGRVSSVFVCGQGKDALGEDFVMIHRPDSSENESVYTREKGSAKTATVGGELWFVKQNGEPLERYKEPIVAVETNKQLQENSKKRVNRGIRFLQKFEGKRGVAQLFGSYSYKNAEEDRIVMVMPYYSGGDLSGYLNNEAKLFYKRPLNQQRKIQLDLLIGLAEIHKAGLVHRDIKPKNIFLRETDKSVEAVIGDFDSAVEMSEDEPRCSISGTLDYLAPEYKKFMNGRKKNQTNDSKEIIKNLTNPSIDIWAMGLIFYQMLDSEKLELINFISLIELARYGSIGFRKPTEESSFEYLVWNMLQINQESRITAEAALEKLKEIIEKESKPQLVSSQTVSDLQNTEVKSAKKKANSSATEQKTSDTMCDCVIQ